MPDMLRRLAGKHTLRVAGLMSGTSADGVDVAIIELRGRQVRQLAFATVPYPDGVRRALFRLFDPDAARIDDLCHMNFVIGELFADALVKVARRSRITLDSIDLVGSHGQTVCHIPGGKRFGRRRLRSTLQVGEPSVIAERTGITTVADFRPRDVAAGGEGAPLVPYADYVLFRDRRKSRTVQNIGGIANVTFLSAGCALADIIAFDTGPGNMVIDRVTSLATRGKQKFDCGGRLAASAEVNEELLAKLMKHRYLRRRPPKSTGRETFGVAFADTLYGGARKARIAARDVIATVTAFTACSIARAYRRFLSKRVDEVILCGGGAHNRTLVRMLRDELPETDVLTMDAFGIDPDAKEAISFAILAAETVRGRPGNVPSATGAEHPVILGKIIPGG